jgi:hypothetical protein
MKHTFNAFGLAFFLATAVVADEQPVSFDLAVTPFLKEHCFRCHDATKQEGEFRLDTLSRDFVNDVTAQKWAEVISRMNAGEMPPQDEPQPKSEMLGKIVDFISARIKEGEATRMARRGPVAHYRLSKEEYANTVYDLLGVHYDVNFPGVFNDDPRWHGFERIGSMLSLSPSHVDRYFKAAETVLQRAFPESVPAPIKVRHDAINLTAQAPYRQRLKERGVADKIRAAYWSGNYSRNRLLPQTGRELLRIRIQLSGLRPPGGRAPHLSVLDYHLKRSIFDQDILAPEDKPIIVEFLATSSAFEIWNDVPGLSVEESYRDLTFISSKDTRFRPPAGRKLVDDNGNAIYPLLLIDWIEWEGPVVTPEDLKKREGLMPTTLGDLAQARECLRRFANRAWRRPVTDVEIDRYLKLVESELAAGENFRSAYMAAMLGILVSKNFYYLEEGSVQEPRDRVNDWELASRLSYFLWGSMPDEALFAAAAGVPPLGGKAVPPLDGGKSPPKGGTPAQSALHDPQTLRTQLARMLADPKISRFTESFSRQWLQLDKVGMFPPDRSLYPDYDKWLEKCMVLETTGFFAEVFSKNLPLREFLDSNWTVVNPRLATHYQMTPPTQSDFQRVALRPEDHRGGLLTQASILSLTSDGTRHRPVHRGVWVSESIFGKTPPPPPPNVEPIDQKPVNAPKATIRMQVEAHATNANCAACHRTIDPLGFAFDNFDAIGRWRTEEVIPTGTGANPPVNASGTLADGRTYQGPEEFKQLLVQDIDRFAEAFVGNLATFALRRVMTMDDADEIQAIVQASRKDDYRIKTVIEQFVLSDLFQKR